MLRGTLFILLITISLLEVSSQEYESTSPQRILELLQQLQGPESDSRLDASQQLQMLEKDRSETYGTVMNQLKDTKIEPTQLLRVLQMFDQLRSPGKNIILQNMKERVTDSLLDITQVFMHTPFAQNDVKNLIDDDKKRLGALSDLISMFNGNLPKPEEPLNSVADIISLFANPRTLGKIASGERRKRAARAEIGEGRLDNSNDVINDFASTTESNSNNPKEVINVFPDSEEPSDDELQALKMFGLFVDVTSGQNVDSENLEEMSFKETMQLLFPEFDPKTKLPLTNIDNIRNVLQGFSDISNSLTSDLDAEPMCGDNLLTWFLSQQLNSITNENPSVLPNIIEVIETFEQLPKNEKELILNQMKAVVTRDAMKNLQTMSFGPESKPKVSQGSTVVQTSNILKVESVESGSTSGLTSSELESEDLIQVPQIYEFFGEAKQLRSEDLPEGITLNSADGGHRPIPFAEKLPNWIHGEPNLFGEPEDSENLVPIILKNNKPINLISKEESKPDESSEENEDEESRKKRNSGFKYSLENTRKKRATGDIVSRIVHSNSANTLILPPANRFRPVIGSANQIQAPSTDDSRDTRFNAINRWDPTSDVTKEQQTLTEPISSESIDLREVSDLSLNILNRRRKPTIDQNIRSRDNSQGRDEFDLQVEPVRRRDGAEDSNEFEASDLLSLLSPNQFDLSSFEQEEPEENQLEVEDPLSFLNPDAFNLKFVPNFQEEDEDQFDADHKLLLDLMSILNPNSDSNSHSEQIFSKSTESIDKSENRNEFESRNNFEESGRNENSNSRGENRNGLNSRGNGNNFNNRNNQNQNQNRSLNSRGRGRNNFNNFDRNNGRNNAGNLQAFSRNNNNGFTTAGIRSCAEVLQSNFRPECNWTPQLGRQLKIWPNQIKQVTICEGIYATLSQCQILCEDEPQCSAIHHCPACVGHNCRLISESVAGPARLRLVSEFDYVDYWEKDCRTTIV